MKAVHKWLSVKLEKKTAKYRHRLFVENDNARGVALPAIQGAVEQAHADTVQDLRSVLDDGLDPLSLGKNDPAHGYPEMLHIETLQGYFGEFLAGVLAEQYKPFDIDWTVPAYLFRFHKAAFDQLARIKQTPAAATKIPGRLGDDCLAFSTDNAGEIVASLCCEAKCLKEHHTTTAGNAHKQLSGAELKPIDLRALITILGSRSDEKSKRWSASLKRLLLAEKLPAEYERCDFLTYISGNAPARRETWLPQDNHQVDYTGGRRFEAAEIHLTGVPELVARIYKKGGNP